jgi:hypothetical protein
MGVSSPTGNGEKRGMEYAGQPGTPLPLRPVRAKANDASSIGTHDMDSSMAADGRTDMRDSGTFTKITIPENQHITNDRAADGITDMKAKAIR